MNIEGTLVTDTSVVFVVDGDTKTATEAHPNWSRIREAVRVEDYSTAVKLMDVSKSVEQFGSGKVQVSHGVVTYNGKELHNSVTARILSMIEEGFNVGPLSRFLENLMENPSYRSVQQLYRFLEATDLPITEDGHIIAYKMVRADYTDTHSGKFDNSVGAVVEMPRNQVDEDPDRTCSYGLHFCSQGYLGSYAYGPRTMIIKINPRDVVAIPTDYNNAKGRCCRYEVIGELEQKDMPEDRTTHSFGTSVYGANANEDDGAAEATMLDLETAAELLCGDCMNPKAALRKRISRGTVRAEYADGTAVRAEVPNGLIPNDFWTSGAGSPAYDTIIPIGDPFDENGYTLIDMATAAEMLYGYDIDCDSEALLHEDIDLGELDTQMVGGARLVKVPNSDLPEDFLQEVVAKCSSETDEGDDFGDNVGC